MAVQKFEDLYVWQKAQDFAVLIYSNFSNLKDNGFKEQITRTSVSISNNSAEGFDRNTNNDFTNDFRTNSINEENRLLIPFA